MMSLYGTTNYGMPVISNTFLLTHKKYKIKQTNFPQKKSCLHLILLMWHWYLVFKIKKNHLIQQMFKDETNENQNKQKTKRKNP